MPLSSLATQVFISMMVLSHCPYKQDGCCVAGAPSWQDKLHTDGPASPSNVQLQFINVSSVLVSWAPQGALFLVLVSHDGGPYLNVSGLLNSTQFVFPDMLYSAYYQFRVVAIVGGKQSPPAQTNYFVNGITAPPGPPSNVGVLDVTTSEVTVVWEAPQTPSPLLYIVHWGLAPSYLNMSLTVAQSTVVKVAPLQLNTSYYFTVTADINSWHSIPSPVVMATTPPPYLPALSVSAAVGVSWALVSWSPPAQDRFPLTISHFSVYTSGSSDGVTQVSPHQSSFNITDLEAGSVWAVGVAYTAGPYESDLSELLEIETLEGVQCLSCWALSSTQLSLGWQVMSTRQGNRSLLVLENGLQISQINSSARSGELVVSGLHPWTGHALSVAIATQTSPCPLLNCWTLEDVPSGPPTAIRLEGLTSHSASLSWSPPVSSQQNGLITSYTLGYRCVGCSTRQLSVERSEVTVDSLHPYTKYLVVVSAGTSVGRGPLSQPLPLTTLEAAPTTGPAGVTVSNVSLSTASVQWSPLPQALLNGVLTAYQVLVTELQQNCYNESMELTVGPPQRVLVTGNRTQLTLAGLAQCTRYSVTVQAATSAGLGPLSAAVYLSTRPAVNRSIDLEAVYRDCDQLSLAWSCPPWAHSLEWKGSVHYQLSNGTTGCQPLPHQSHSTTLTEPSVVSLWLTITVLLEGGASVALSSPPTTPGPCTISGNVVIAVCGVSLLLPVAAVILTCCVLYRWRKCRLSRPQSTYVMDDLTLTAAVDNDYFSDPTLRVSDGCSSESDSMSCDSRVSSCDSALLELSETAPLISSDAGMSKVVASPLAGRQNPDGCSLSDSTDSSH